MRVSRGFAAKIPLVYYSLQRIGAEFERETIVQNGICGFSSVSPVFTRNRCT